MMTNQEFLKEMKSDLYPEPFQYDRDEFPCSANFSSAMIYRFLPVPAIQEVPEFIHVDNIRKKGDPTFNLFIEQWNLAWEAGHLRHEMFEKEIPEQLSWLHRYSHHNINLIPKSRHNYFGHQHILNLLPGKTRVKFNLPYTRRGLWPSNMAHWYMDDVLPKDFKANLSNAFAYHIWPLLGGKSHLNKFNAKEPLSLLSHNLNYWAPFLDQVIHEKLMLVDRIPSESKKDEKERTKMSKRMQEGITAERPRHGCYFWLGEDDAWAVTKELVDKADNKGNLRSIIDTIKSHRVQDDFSNLWSFEKEDFERKMYQKRNKIRVSFVEVDDALPVHSSTAEVHEKLLWEDFFAILNRKEREIVVCLKSGITKMSDVSTHLGYANHSPVSKAMASIRKKAKLLLA